VVDDDEDVRVIVSFRLRQAGFEVREVNDGPAAIAAASQHLPDLVILDVSMPGMSGLDVCRLLRADARTADVAIIMLTSRGRETDIGFGLDFGADDYVVKPFSPRELVSRVQRQLSRVGK
jgi:DNA-binding response OmpR family regulator